MLGEESKSCDNINKYIFVALYQLKVRRSRKLKNKINKRIGPNIQNW